MSEKNSCFICMSLPDVGYQSSVSYYGIYTPWNWRRIILFIYSFSNFLKKMHIYIYIDVFLDVFFFTWIVERLVLLLFSGHWPFKQSWMGAVALGALPSESEPWLRVAAFQSVFPPLSPGRGSAVASSCPGWDLNKWGFEGDLCQSDGEGLQPSGGG